MSNVMVMVCEGGGKRLGIVSPPSCLQWLEIAHFAQNAARLFGTVVRVHKPAVAQEFSAKMLEGVTFND